MPNIIRFAIVGAGSMGRGHVRRIRESGRGRVVAVCDVSRRAAAALASECGARSVYTDFEKLCRSRAAFEAAVVATPNVAHAPVSVALLDAGKSVYCEKPPAVDAAAAATICAAEKRSKGRFMVGFNQRFDPWAQHVKAQIEAGRLGRIYHAQTQWHRRYYTPSFGTWFCDRKLAGGGPLLDIGVHRLDQTLWLMGFPRVLSVSGVTCDHLARLESRRSGRHCSVEDFAAGMIKLEGGASVLLQASYLGYLPNDAPEMGTLLMGTRCGCLESGGRLRIMTNGHPGPQDTILRDFDVPRTSAMDHFLDCVARNRQPMCTAAQGHAVMQVVDALYESSATGKEVVLSNDPA